MEDTISNPYNLDAAQAEIKRREALLAALQQQAGQEIQPVGSNGGVARISPLQVIGKLLQTYVGKQEGERVGALKDKAAQESARMLQEGFKQYANTSSARAVEAQGPPTEQGEIPTMIQPGDPRKAVLNALSSGHPLLRKFGEDQMKHLNTSELEAGKQQAQLARELQLAQINKSADLQRALLPHLAPEGIPDFLNNGAFKPKPTDITIGDAIFRQGPDGYKPVGGMQYAEPTMVNGDRVQRNAITGKETKIDNAPQTKITTSVNANILPNAQKQGLEEMFKLGAKAVNESGAKARAAGQMIHYMTEMENLDKEGIFSNKTSGLASFTNNLAQAFGFTPDPKLKGTEAFNAVTNKVWQDLVAQGEGGNRGITKEEAMLIREQLPLASHSPEARTFIYATLRRGAERLQAQHKSGLAAYQKAIQMQDITPLAEVFGDIQNPPPREPNPAIQAPTTKSKIEILSVRPAQ